MATLVRKGLGERSRLAYLVVVESENYVVPACSVGEAGMMGNYPMDTP